MMQTHLDVVKGLVILGFKKKALYSKQRITQPCTTYNNYLKSAVQ